MDCYISYLKGHSKDVTCLSSFNNLLASSSEDGTVRIWDQTSQKSIRRLTDPQFFPSNPVENVSLHNFSVYLTSSNSLYEFDIRNPSKIILPESHSTLSFPEDISSIDQTDSKALICLDNGDFIVLDKPSKETTSSFTPHNNVRTIQVCAGMFFMQDLIVSAGFDCKVMLSQTDGEVVSGVNLEDIFANRGFNPPHVYGLSVKENLVAFALGNGNLCVFEHRDRLVGTRNFKAHEERVMCVNFCRFGDLIVSASNSDLAFWRENEVKRVGLGCKVIER